MKNRAGGWVLLLVAGLIAFPRVAAAYSFSRLIVYDVRGMRAQETALVLEQRGDRVTIWMKNYLGRRVGRVPTEEYRSCFEGLQRIQKFALKKKYRGRLLRTHAARGMITLAWQDEDGKQVRTIKYYAPEHTLDDFRAAFNRIWALSRYAILSLNSFQNQRVEFLEEAVYFLAGAGWMTLKEVRSVVDFHREQGNDLKLARAVWRALDQRYPASSAFSQRSYLEYCVRKSLEHLGPAGVRFLQAKKPKLRGRKLKLAEETLEKLTGTSGPGTLEPPDPGVDKPSFP